MRVAHFAQFGPNRCGLYHTAKDLIIAECMQGIDAGMVDFSGEKHGGVLTDGDFVTKDLAWAEDADILVRHSALPDAFHNSGKPIVFSIHGRPDSSVRLDASDAIPVVRTFATKAQDHRYKAYLMYWKEHIPVWSNILPADKLFYVPAMINAQEHRSHTDIFDLSPYIGSPNILIADLWREDVIPIHAVFAAHRFAQMTPGARVHIVGVPSNYMKAMMPFFVQMRNEGTLGMLAGQRADIKSIYNACDIVVTPHIIATRVVRESLIRGIPIIAPHGSLYTPYTAQMENYNAAGRQILRCWKHLQMNRDMVTAQVKELADTAFSLEVAGKAVMRAYDYVLNKSDSLRKKWFIDVGGHLGQSIRRFYREVENAHQYNIVSFEPDPETFVALMKNAGHVPNVELINKAAATHNSEITFYRGGINDNEGGTTLRQKLTGGVDYKHPIQVGAIDFCSWMKDTVSEDDYVVVKINIEGGEYDLMEKMLDDNITPLIDRMYIQLHSHKFSPCDMKWRFQEIERRFHKEAQCAVSMQHKGFERFDCE